MLINSSDRKIGDRRLDAAATLYRRHGAGGRWLQRVARIRAAARNGHAVGVPWSLAETLSQREVEVLCLGAAGRSNQEIADALVLSVRTVERHLVHIYDKLGTAGKSAGGGQRLRHRQRARTCGGHVVRATTRRHAGPASVRPGVRSTTDCCPRTAA
jgi:DNA-binding CsgD family transcriptional regulator